MNLIGRSRHLIRKARQLGQSLFVPSLLFIVATPMAISLLPNFNFTSDSRLLRLNFVLLWVPLLSSIYVLSKRRYVLFSISLPFILLGGIEILHLLVLKAPLSEASLHVIFETNISEALDYINMSWSLWSVSITLLYLLTSITFLVKETTAETTNLVISRISICTFIMVASIISYKVSIGQTSSALPRVVNAALIYSHEINEYRRISEKRARSQNFSVGLEGTSTFFEGQQTFVLIIGESTSRNHMSLYGYGRKTTPGLESMQDDLLVFQDVVSPFTLTQPVLKMAMTTTNKDNNSDFFKAHGLIDAARAAGFTTYWLSNQSPLGLWDNFVSVMAQSADRNLFVNVTGKSYDSLRRISYDGKILPFFEKALQYPDHKKLIILHLMGAHFKYDKRYPPEYAKFPTSSIKKEDVVNSYDNAVLYNDYVVSKLIALFKEHCQRQDQHIGALLFFSDHGEEVYEIDDWAGHEEFRPSRYQVEIPFVVWLDEQYKHQAPLKYMNMHMNLGMPYMTDDLFHSTLDLMGINSPIFDKRRSLFSSNYTPRKRLIYGKDYETELKPVRLSARDEAF